MVNLEGLTINKYINKNELFTYEHCNEVNNFFSLYDVVNNKVIIPHSEIFRYNL